MNDTLVLLALAALGAYLLACWIWPYKVCSWCRGRSRATSPTGRAFRDRRCWRCGGTGRTVRLGRRMFELTRGDGHHRD